MPDPNEDLDPNEVALPPLPPGPFDPIDLGPLLDLRNLPDIAAVIANPDVKGELPRAEAADKYGSFREDHADPAKEVFTTFFSYLGTTTPRKDREAWADRGYEWVDRLVAFLSQARKTGEIAVEHAALRDAIQSIIERYKRMWREKVQETPDRHPLAKHFGPAVSGGNSAVAGDRRLDCDKREHKDLSDDTLTSGKSEWRPPEGYVGTKDIQHSRRFDKGGKNPVSSTIQRWVKRDKREAQETNREPIRIVQAPDTHENYYPEAWIHEQIRRWSPRKPTA